MSKYIRRGIREPKEHCVKKAYFQPVPGVSRKRSKVKPSDFVSMSLPYADKSWVSLVKLNCLYYRGHTLKAGNFTKTVF